MPDVGWSSSPPPAPSPPFQPRYDPQGQAGVDGSAFQQALQDAAPNEEADGFDPETQADDGEDSDTQGSPVERKKGRGDAAGLAGGLAALLGGAPRHAQALRERGESEGRQGGLGGLEAPVPKAPQVQPTRAGGVDLDAFADLIDRAAAQAPLSPGQTFQLALGDPRAPVNSVSMTRLPDGTLSITLGTDNEAVTQVRATLEALRRRLEARGVPVAVLTAEGANAGVEQQDTA